MWTYVGTSPKQLILHITVAIYTCLCVYTVHILTFVFKSFDKSNNSASRAMHSFTITEMNLYSIHKVHSIVDKHKSTMECIRYKRCCRSFAAENVSLLRPRSDRQHTFTFSRVLVPLNLAAKFWKKFTTLQKETYRNSGLESRSYVVMWTGAVLSSKHFC